MPTLQKRDILAAFEQCAEIAKAMTADGRDFSSVEASALKAPAVEPISKEEQAEIRLELSQIAAQRLRELAARSVPEPEAVALDWDDDFNCRYYKGAYPRYEFRELCQMTATAFEEDLDLDVILDLLERLVPMGIAALHSRLATSSDAKNDARSGKAELRRSELRKLMASELDSGITKAMAAFNASHHQEAVIRLYQPKGEMRNCSLFFDDWKRICSE